MPGPRLVVRFMNGSVAKGYTSDFLPERQIFHLTAFDAKPGTPARQVYLKACKAIFFVKNYYGDPGHRELQQFSTPPKGSGRKIRVRFKDCEVLVGTTHGYDPGRLGFFVFPADVTSNNYRSFVIIDAVSDVSFL